MAQALAIAAPAADAVPASAARTGPVSVHLTGFAPGCEKLGIQSPRRWATFYGRTISQVVRSTLTRCRLDPARVTTAAEVNGDVNLLAPVPPELLALQSSEPGVPVPFAIFWDGLAQADLDQELARLRAAGWRPADLYNLPN